MFRNVCVAILAAGLLIAAPAHAATLSHGPIIGDVAPDHVQVWGRTSGTATVTVEYAQSGLAMPGAALTVGTAADSDYTFSLRIPNLAPGTEYDYRVLVDGSASVVRTFRTAAPNGDPAELVVAFVSDAFGGAASTVWAAVDAQAPDGFFIIGDFDHSNPATNTLDATGYLKKLRDMHRRLRGPETPIGRDFVGHVIERDLPLLGRILDDHDSGSDNVDSKFKWWGPNIQAFLEYHPVPADNGFPAGMWQAVQRGNALFLLLDLRSHRVSTGTKTILGSEQKAWLTAKLDQCATDPDVTWCVIVSTVPFNPNQQKLDSWHGYPADSQWLLDQIAVHQLRNVLVVSGDCHWGSIVRPPLSPLVELNIPQANQGFSNTCNNNAAQWTLNSAQAGTGFGLLTLRAYEAVLDIYNANGTRRLSTTVPEGASSPADRDGDGVPDTIDACPDVAGDAPSGCPVTPPEGGDVTQTFVRLDGGGQRYDVEVPPYVCARRTGGTSLLQIIKVTAGVETVLKSTAVSNPAIGVPFELRCQVTTAPPATVTSSLDGVVKLTVAAQ